MPISCPGGGKPRYRMKGGAGGTRLAFCGGKVVEAKNMRTHATHTPAEFARDRAKKPKKKRRMK